MAETTTWPALAESLYDRLTARKAEISYNFSSMKIDVPSSAGANSQHAQWVLDGTLTISTRDGDSGPN